MKLQCDQNPHAELALCVCVCVAVAHSCPTLCDPMDYSLPGSSAHEFSRQELITILAGGMAGVGSHSFSRGSPRHRDQLGSPALQADSVPPEPPGKALLLGRYNINNLHGQKLPTRDVSLHLVSSRAAEN